MYAGLLEGLDDKYTEYYTPEEFENLQISATQNYCGIGAVLSQDKDSMQVTATHIYEGSPAEDAGLKDGDVIAYVDEIEASSLELTELVTHIRGEEGTTVHLKVYREGESDYVEMDVKRENIDLPTIEHKMLEGNIGYIRFGNVAGKGFVCIGEPPDLERRFGFFGDKQNAAVLFQGEQRRGQGGIFVYDGFCVSSGIRIAVFQNRFGYGKRFLVVGKRAFFGDGRFFGRNFFSRRFVR